MNAASVVRFLSFTILIGSATSLALGNGAFAENIVAPAPNVQQPAVSTAEPQPSLPLTQEASNTKALNWAGYTATGGTYTSVSGSWIIPTVNTSGSENVADATWVGIGGVLSSDLIQAGTEAIPDSNGDIVYRAWLETLPKNSRVVPLTIAPGDAISVSITEESAGVWDVAFTNATTGKSYSTSVQYESSLSSAEWIEEMPVEVGGIVGLDNFGTLHFTAGYAIKNGRPVTIGSSGAQPLTMENQNGIAVAQTSQLGSNGSSFDVVRTDAVSTPLALTERGVSAIAIDPYALASSATQPSVSEYRPRSHRGWGVYRIYIQF